MSENMAIETPCKTITYKVITCRDLYIKITFKVDEPEKIDYVLIQSSTKQGGCPVSFLEAFGDMLSFSIRRIRNIHEARQIVKNLRHHKCLECPPNKNHYTSCTDAIGAVLEEALKTKEK